MANPGVIVIEGSQNPETPSTPASHAPVACLAFSSVHSRTKNLLSRRLALRLHGLHPWCAYLVLNALPCQSSAQAHDGAVQRMQAEAVCNAVQHQ